MAARRAAPVRAASLRALASDPRWPAITSIAMHRMASRRIHAFAAVDCRLFALSDEQRPFRFSRHPHRRPRPPRRHDDRARRRSRRRRSCRSARRAPSKALTHRDLEGLGAQILLSNTYHLYLRPGRRSDRPPRRPAPLHRLDANRSSPTAAATRCSASPTRRTIDEQGARFQSHLDGSAHLLTPEKADRHPGAARIGHRDGARRVPGASRRTPERRGHRCCGRVRWARRARGSGSSRCRAGRSAGVTVTNPGQAQFGIVQGGVFPELREESAQATVDDRLRGVRDRRTERRRADRRHVRHGRADDAVAARRSAAISDGRGHAAGSRRIGGAGRRSVRLRAADPQRAGTASCSRARGASISRTRATPRTSGRPIRSAAATRAGPVHAPISGIFFWPAR